MPAVEVITLILNDDGQVIAVRPRPLSSKFEQGKTLKDIKDLFKNFGKTVISQGKTTPIENLVASKMIDESPHLNPAEKEAAKDLVEMRGLLDNIEYVKASELPDFKNPIGKVTDQPPTPKKLVQIFIDP
jgi:hypothetical protein